MTGSQFKDWVLQSGIKPEQIALDLDVSMATVYKWYRSEKISRVVCLALMQKYGKKGGAVKKAS